MSAEPGLLDSEQYALLYGIVAFHTPTLARSWQGGLEEVARLELALAELKLRLVDDAARGGATWKQIGFCLGITAQGASQLHKRARAAAARRR